VNGLDGWLSKILGIINQKIDTGLGILSTIQKYVELLNGQYGNLLKQQQADHELLLETHDLSIKNNNLSKENYELSKENNKLLKEIVAILTPPTQNPAGVVLTLAVEEKENQTMAKSKSAKATASISVADDGTLSLNVLFTDEDGLPITSYTSWPSQVALPSVAFSDAAPGPSSLNFVPAATIAPSTDAGVPSGSLDVGAIVPVTPLPSPLPTGYGQNVDTQVTFASGLTNQTSPLTIDAGDITITADASQPSGVSVSVEAP